MKPGLIHIYTGNGKGKTTAALGLAFRAYGYNKRIYVLQFLKGRKTGEVLTAERLERITFEQVNSTSKFVYEMNDEEKSVLVEEIKDKWAKLKTIVQDSEYDIIILDEIMAAINQNLLNIKEVLKLIENRKDDKELILTGRDVPDKLVSIADYVTEMKLIKHPYSRGTQARKGIEF